MGQHESIHSVHNLLKYPDECSHTFVEAMAHAGDYRIVGILHGGTGFQHKVNEFYRKYGGDGLLAIMASKYEPETISDLEKMEGGLITQGCLSKKGFTPKGVEWFRRRVPQATILERLKQILENRAINRLPVS